MGTLSPVRAAAILALCPLLVGCDSSTDPAPLPEFTLVHSVVLAGSHTIRVRLERVDGELGIRYMVPEARVAFRSEAGETVLPWVPGSPCVEAVTLPVVGLKGCYTTELSDPLTAGAEYAITADFTDGSGPVTGQTRVPLQPVFRILEQPWMRYPLPHPFIPVRLEWDPDPVAGRIEARLEFLRGHQRGGAWTVDDCSVDLNDPFVHDPRTGPAEIRIRSIGCDFDWDSIHVRLVSTAFDTAYARYVRLAGASSLGIPADQTSAGVEGALGLFGAAASSAGEFYILRESAPE